MPSDIQEKLKVLVQAYAMQLPTKAQEVQSLWLAIKEKKDYSQIEPLTRAAHTLAGTAGTYGYSLVSNIARKLEEILRSDGQSAIDNKRNELDNLIQDLSQVVLNPPDEDVTDIGAADNYKSERNIIYNLVKNTKIGEQQFEAIRNLNYTVKHFNKAIDLINEAYKKRPDMIILDVELAKDVPVEITKKFLNDLILLVYTTEKDDLMSHIFSIRHGGQAVLTEPFEESLLRVIDTLIEARKLQDERILIVDDSEFLANYYAMILEKAGMKTQKVIDPRNFLQIFQEFQPDLILMDVNMPYCSGAELAQIVQQKEDLNVVPIIYLSTITAREKQLQLLSLAGDDFLTKPIEPNHLLIAIRNRLMKARMLRLRIIRDSLTNLYNHTMIHQQLNRELTIAKRYKKELCVVILDIDYFKNVNDTYGHQAGDKILKDFSAFLRRNLRQTDLIGRYGGEEFLLILPNTTFTSALKICDKLREEFAKMPHMIDDQKIYITFSGGIASFPQHKAVKDLVKAADIALYKAKEQGRNCIKS